MKYIVFAVLSITSWTAFAQQPPKKSLSLADALEMVRANNYELRESMADIAVAKSQLRSAYSAFLPDIEVSENYVATNDPLNVFGLKLKQGTVTASDFNPELLNEPESIENFNTRVSLQQPILNFDAFAQKGALKDFYDASQMSHQRNVQHVRYLTKKSYYGLLLAEMNIRIAQQAKKASAEGLKIAKDNLEAGYILQSDLLAAEVRDLSAKNQLSAAKAEYFNALQQFKYLLRLDHETEIVLSDSLSFPEFPAVISDSAAVHDGRSDMSALGLMSDGQQKILKAQKLRYLPNLNMMLSYEWNDDIAFGNAADNYLVGVSLKWKLFDGYKREANIQKARSEFEKSQIQKEKQLAQANIELKNALNQLEISYEQIRTFSIASKRAEELYKIKKDRFKVGLEKTADVIEAEADVSRQKTALQNSLYQYYSSIFTIEYLLEQEII